MKGLNTLEITRKIDRELEKMILDYRLNDTLSRKLFEAYYSEMKNYLSDGHMTIDEFRELTNRSEERYRYKLREYADEGNSISKETKEFLDFMFDQ